jgi:hypothetical protein
MQVEVKKSGLPAACEVLTGIPREAQGGELTREELESIAGGGRGLNLWSWYPRKRRADAANNNSLRNVRA